MHNDKYWGQTPSLMEDLFRRYDPSQNASPPWVLQYIKNILHCRYNFWVIGNEAILKIYNNRGLGEPGMIIGRGDFKIEETPFHYEWVVCLDFVKNMQDINFRKKITAYILAYNCMCTPSGSLLEFRLARY